MKGRERFLTALNNERPDRLPCQMHHWMTYYLNTYLHGMSDLEAYRYLGMDPVLYRGPDFIYNPSDLSKWEEKFIDLGVDQHGVHHWEKTIITPKGQLHTAGSWDVFTSWVTEMPIKNEGDFELWNEFIPLPEKVDWTPVIEAKKEIGDTGIVRGGFFDFGQGSPWQSFCDYLFATEPAIFMAMDDPDWLHYALKSMLDKKLKVIERAGKFELDLVETGGGGGSCSVISPSMHKEFCLPYDKIQHEAIHNAGCKVVYHLCGKLMDLLQMVVENGADALETMTPPGMGADCDIAKADREVGDKLCFIGGFDQNAGFERGNPSLVRKMVHELFEACQHGGYIVCPSDHFFFGDPENLRAFADAAKECIY